ncbi:MAG: hypothetical protein JO340_08115 [Acidobacteriaceae bacterium]|nr:hypothetical protein [Acidobacteriaceae bacterium]
MRIWSRIVHNAFAISIPMLLSGAQRGNDQDVTRADIRRIVEASFSRNVEQGTTKLSPGREAYTRVPLSAEDVSRIVAFGGKAIPVLSEYFDSPKVRFEELAVRCTGVIGGTDGVQALERAALTSKFLGVRVQAVMWLGSLPGVNVDIALREIGKVSGDQLVRQEALKFLTRRSAQQ